VDAEGRAVADGVTGEIHVESESLCAGYWGQPAAWTAALAGGSFRTGDLAVRSADGYYTLQGRRSELIISAGFNIYPREIEEWLVEQDSIVDAAVVGAPDPVRAQELYQRACQNGDADSCGALEPLPEPAVEPAGAAEPPAPAAPASSLGDRLAEACDQGDNAACADLGARSTHGDGVPRDTALAARLFQRACANGAMEACTDLGILYEVGEGVSRDETRAERLFQLACNGGAGDERACGLLEE
jgi:acyl-CoA synthetase (AMP-forming)/AMP-acid ligase II